MRLQPAQARGFALIDLVFVIGVIGVLSAMALPRLITARQAAGSASAIGSLRTLNSSQLTFALTCGSGFYAPDLVTLGTPPPGSNEPFVTSGLGDANVVTRSGYVIQLEATAFSGAPPSCNGLGGGMTGQGFRAAADPVEPNTTRHFATNANTLIFENDSTLYAVMPEIGEPPIGHLLR